MSALLRARISAFAAGVAVAGVFGVYQLRGDVAEGHQRLLEQVGQRPCLGLDAHPPPSRQTANCCLCQLSAAPIGTTSLSR